MSALQLSAGIPEWAPQIGSPIAKVPRAVSMTEQDFAELYNQYLQEVQNVGLDAFTFIRMYHVEIV